jgi:hypothetical protein
MTLRLVPPVGSPIDLKSDRALLGRDPGADIVVNDPSVSRRHAILERRPEGWAVFDQRSANGTWLDNVRIEQALLQPGQQLRLGAVAFSVDLPGAMPRGLSTIPPQPNISPYGQPAYQQPPPPPVYQPAPAPAYPPPQQQPAYMPQQPAYAPPPQPAYAAPPAPPAQPPGYPPQPSYPPAGYPQAPAPVYSQPGAGAPPAAPPPRPAPPGGGLPGGMTEAEAAELLGLWPGTPAEDVRRRYQKLFNDFQIRITNAPTPALKKMYQKNIQDLKTAADLISPGAIV